MATYATLTVPVADIIGESFGDMRRASVWIVPNTPKGFVIADGIRVGGRREQVVDGQVVFPNLVTTNTATNPTSFSYVVTITCTPKGQSKDDGPLVVTTSEFPLTTTRNLKDIEEAWDEWTAPPSWRSTFTDQMDVKLLAASASAESAAAAADLAKAISNANTADDLITILDADPTSDLRVQQDARLALMLVDSMRLYAKARTGTIAALGDSNTINGWDPYDVGGGLMVTLADSWLRWVEAHSYHAASVVYNGGVIGDKTSDMLARLPLVTSSGADFATVMGGTNDIFANRTLAAITADLTTIYETIIDAGMLVVAMQVLPATTFTTAQNTLRNQVNTWIANYAATHPGIIPVVFNGDVTVSGSPDAAAPTLFRPDGIHLRAGAAIRIGRRVWEAIDRYMVSQRTVIDSNSDPANALTNGLMLGSTSGVATGWSITTPDAASYSVSKVARTDGQPGEWQRIDMTSGTLYVDRVTAQASNPVWTSTTQSLIGEFEFMGDTTNLTQHDVTILAENSSGGVHKRAMGYYDAYTSANRGPVPNPILMRTYPLSGYNVAATHARVRMTLKGAGTFYVSRAALRVRGS